MKKITRIAALLAAGALLFGAFGCSSGGDGDGDDPSRGTTPVSYTLKAGTPGFDSGSLEVSGMDTTDDTGDDTFEMTLKPIGKDAVTVTGTWELTTEDSFVCKSDANVTIDDITVNAGESVPGTLNEDDSITLTVAEGKSLVFVKDEDSGGTPPEAGEGDSYDFADLTAADITALQLESGKTLGQAALINNLNAKVLNSKVTIKQDQAKFKLKGKGDDPIAVAFGTDAAGRTASDAMPALTAGSALELKRYISYPTTSGKKIQVKIECGEGMTNDIADGSYLVLTSASNKVLVSKAISKSDTSVTLDAFNSEDSFNLGVLRGSQSGTFYVGKVTITEISGGDSSNNGSETPGGTPGEDGGDEEGDDNNSGTVTPGTPGSGDGEDGGEDKEPGEVTPPEEEPSEELVKVILFNYANTNASLTDTTIEGADSDFVTISDVTFELENDTNNIGWGTEPAVASVDSKLSTAAGTTTKIGYRGATGTGTESAKYGEGVSIAKVKFTVTPKSSVTLKGLKGYLRYASTQNYKGKVTIGGHTYTSEAADSSSKVVVLSDDINDISATSDPFDVVIQFVSSKSDGASVKGGQNIDVFNVELAFAAEE